jgi:hypothetical protein
LRDILDNAIHKKAAAREEAAAKLRRLWVVITPRV